MGGVARRAGVAVVCAGILTMLVGRVGFASAEEPADTRSSYTEVLVVGVESVAYRPLYTVEAGTYEGYARALLDAFAADTGLTLDYRPMPVTRLYASFAAGRIDLKFPDNPAWNRPFRDQHAVVYSVPAVAVLDASVVRADRADLTPEAVRTLGTVVGFSPWPWAERITMGSVTLVENADFVSLVRQVLAGRVDAAYASIAVVNRVLDVDLKQPGALVAAPHLPQDSVEYRLSTIARPDIIGRFDAWMETQDARVRALKADYGVERGVNRDGSLGRGP